MPNELAFFPVAVILILALVLLQAACGWLDRLAGRDKPGAVSITPVRGEGLVPAHRAARAAARRRAADPSHPSDFPGIPFGGALLPLSSVYSHFLVQGVPGSGKSVTLELLLSALIGGPMASRPGKFRVVLFDPKTEWPSKLFARLPPQAGLDLFHPFDARGVRWDLCRDFRTPAEFNQLAEMLVPEDKHDQNRYFRDAARALVAGAVTALAAHRGEWRLGDVIAFSRTRPRLKALLDLRRETRDVAAQFLSARSAKDVLATAGACLDKFTPVAACWDRAAAGRSLRDFMAGSGALVLGHDPRVKFAIENINRLVVKRLTDVAIARQGQDDLTVFMFDEFRQFGASEGLLNVAIQGRSSGAALVVAFQDINGLDATHDGKKARELCALLQNRVFLTAGSDEAATFASAAFGKQEVKQTVTNASGTGAGDTRSLNKVTQVVQREVVLPAEVKGLSLADPVRDALTGYYLSPVTGGFRHEGPFRAALEALPASARFPNLVRRPAAHQALRPRGRADLTRLNLPPTAELLAALGV